MTVTSLGRQLSQEDLSVQCPAATNCQMTPASGLTLTDATDHGGDGEAITGDQGT